MRNHSKVDKDKNKQLRTKTLKKSPTYGTHHSVVLKKIKEMTHSESATKTIDAHTAPSTTTATTTTQQECIYLDAGSKKSYIDLTESKATVKPYPRISVIRSVGAQSPSPITKTDQYEFYQEKPVDFSPKHKYKTEYTTNDSKNMSDGCITKTTRFS